MGVRTFIRAVVAGAGVWLASGSLRAQLVVQWPASAGGNDHYYMLLVIPGGITWPLANTVAQASGGYLATLTSAAENSFVYTNLAAQMPSAWVVDGAGNSEGPLLGGYQPVSSDGASGWNWVTGESWSYTTWAPGEPSNGGGTEDRLIFFGNGPMMAPNWNDVNASYAAPSFLIEFNGVPIPEPPAAALLAAVGAAGAILGRRRARPGRTA